MYGGSQNEEVDDSFPFLIPCRAVPYHNVKTGFKEWMMSPFSTHVAQAHINKGEGLLDGHIANLRKYYGVKEWTDKGGPK